jgi:hypothetical protein
MPDQLVTNRLMKRTYRGLRARDLRKDAFATPLGGEIHGM